MEVPGPAKYAPALVLFVVSLAGLVGPGSHAASPAKKKIPSQPKPPSAEALYRRSLSADSDYAYTGREYYTEWRFDDRTFASVEDVAHNPPSSDLTTYLAPAGSKGRMVLQNGNRFWTYIPARRMIVRTFEPSESAPPQGSGQFKLLLSNYVLSVAPKPTTIAGRKAFEIGIRPRVFGRPYTLLWIDPVTGVVLRREDYHSGGALASVTYFGVIRFHPKFRPREFSPQQWNRFGARVVDQPMRGETAVNTAAPPVPFAGKAVFPPSISGFALQRATLLTGGRTRMLHLIYSDGLNPLSLYEGVRHGRGPTRVPDSRPVEIAPGVFGRTSHQYAYVLLTWDSGPLYYTLVSDLSLPNLIRVADATGAVRPPAIPARHR